MLELLITIGILALMMSASVPMLMNSQRASALTQGGNMVADLTSLARQTALSKNTITALIVVEKPATSKQPLIMLEYDALTESWKPLSGWMRVPEAARVVDMGTAIQAQSNTKARTIAPLSLKVDGKDLENTIFSTLIFYPDGRMENFSEPTRRLSVRYANADPQATAESLDNFYDVVINANSSASRIERP